MAMPAKRTKFHVGLVEPSYTSKTCSGCGAVFEHLSLSDRWVECDCGTSLDRDHNAAINILQWGRNGPSGSSPLKYCLQASRGSAMSCPMRALSCAAINPWPWATAVNPSNGL